MENSKQPAFPPKVTVQGDWYAGLSKREYTAIMAMQGILACPADDLPEHAMYPDGAARYAVEMADYLLAELEKPQSPPK